MDEKLEPVYQFILRSLGISLDAQMDSEYPIHIGERELLIDLVVNSRDAMVLIDINPRINEDTIYKIYALSHLIDKQLVRGKELRLVCAGKSIKYSAQELSAKLGVEILLIPPKLYRFFAKITPVPESGHLFEHQRTNPSRLTSEKAWKVICSIMEGKSPSILAVSKKTGVSYGWTNALIHKLVDTGIVENDNGIRIRDVDRLLNLVSWERALEGLHLETIKTAFSTATKCMKEIALNLNKLGIDYAFTAHSAALFYGTSVSREDTVYLYLVNTFDREFVRSYSDGSAEGCFLKVYTPDRNIMKDSSVLADIRVVDICQNILDLAGLGNDGRTSAKELIRKIGK